MPDTSSSPMVRFRFFQVEVEKHRIQVGRQGGEAIHWFLSGERTTDELVELRNGIKSSNATVPVVLTRLISLTPELLEFGTTMFFLHEQEEILELLESMEAYLQMVGERMEQWPTSVEGAVEQLLSQMTESNKAVLRDATEDDLVMIHYDLGLSIRNSFGLWAGNKALLKSCGAEDMHPDDASAIIIERMRKRLKKIAGR